MDTCYLLYDYTLKCEKCSFFASNEKKNGATKIIYYVAYDYQEKTMKQFWELDWSSKW